MNEYIFVFDDRDITELDSLLGDWLETEYLRRYPIEKLAWKSYIFGIFNGN